MAPRVEAPSPMVRPQQAYGERREPTLESCPLTSTYAPWYPCIDMCAHTHVCVHIHTRACSHMHAYTEAQKGGREEREKRLKNVSGKNGGVIIPISEWICKDKCHSPTWNV